MVGAESIVEGCMSKCLDFKLEFAGIAIAWMISVSDAYAVYRCDARFKSAVYQNFAEASVACWSFVVQTNQAVNPFCSDGFAYKDSAAVGAESDMGCLGVFSFPVPKCRPNQHLDAGYQCIDKAVAGNNRRAGRHR
jgi:hypothetical protein